VKVTILGSSPAWPNPGGSHAGVLVETPAGRLLLDCGPGVLGRLREREEWPSVDAIAITHFHLDHCGDLVPWVWGSFHHRVAQERHPALWVYEGGREHLARLGGLLGFTDMFERAFAVNEYGHDTPFRVAGVDVTALRLPHYTVETYGFRIEQNGCAFAYSGDTGPTDSLVTLARDVDLFLCEATLRDGADDGAPRGHLSVDEALAAARAAGARELVLTHRPSELAVPDGVRLAHDGLVLDV
jgi:ribonuclease BN (tRNA processing enzyme)